MIQGVRLITEVKSLRLFDFRSSCDNWMPTRFAILPSSPLSIVTLVTLLALSWLWCSTVWNWIYFLHLIQMKLEKICQGKIPAATTTRLTRWRFRSKRGYELRKNMIDWLTGYLPAWMSVSLIGFISDRISFCSVGVEGGTMENETKRPTETVCVGAKFRNEWATPFGLLFCWQITIANRINFYPKVRVACWNGGEPPAAGE